MNKTQPDDDEYAEKSRPIMSHPFHS